MSSGSLFSRCVLQSVVCVLRRKLFEGSVFFRRVLVILGACCVTSLDLYTKRLCASMFENITEVKLLPILNFVKVHNTGMSFGLFAGYQFSNLFFLLINVPAVLVVLFLSFREKRLVACVAWSFILGGAVANVTDRVRFGAVRDFIDFHFLDLHWPVFNVADAAIFLGVVFVLFHSTSEKVGSIN
ncbi:signal peptidase II [Neorickettsia sennetsu str. Miyayama]|uniref:Lipoprotein signal peptidase n=1 Tax=Ehrlichia sennetsu (strain ATCC VR-367 / Miyayama) TaxID=222891 RepID=Q2GCL7_EHRS3|nr:signal peptidase II [Neorickettsia sennetsu str. Miyayama]